MAVVYALLLENIVGGFNLLLEFTRLSSMKLLSQVTMSCMIYIAYRKYTSDALGNSLMTIFYRDGISYFIILSGA